jgi:hypothetical protein
MERVEEQIRDFLSENITFISNDLTFIQKEYPLPNNVGTRGRIDILAKDEENNFVIIEIKRSNQTARQAITEVCKYSALLKQNLHIKDSEIRIIIISTTWDELLVPFSEFKKHSLLLVEGYEISIDGSNIPINIKKVKPADNNFIRKLSRNYIVFLYDNKEIFKNVFKQIESLMSLIGLKDYILILEECNIENEMVVYPYAIYVVFQRYDEHYYLEKIRDIADKLDVDMEDAINYKYFCESDEEYLQYLENCLLMKLTEGIESDDLEIGYPEKFLSSFDFGWKVAEIIKNGYFKKDLRLTDSMIIYEVCGLDGINIQSYANQTHSKFKAKLVEIKDTSKECLFFNNIWKQSIDSIFSNIINRNTDFRINVLIFNPNTILESLVKAYYYKNDEFLPFFEITVDYVDEELTEIYRGIIEWNGTKNHNLNEILRRFFYKNSENYFIYTHTGDIRKFDIPITNYLGLEYKTEVTVLQNKCNDTYNVDFKGNDIILREKTNEKTIKDFMNESHEFINELIGLYSRYTAGFFK